MAGEGPNIEDVDWCVQLPGMQSFCAPIPDDPSVVPLMARFAKDIVHSCTGHYGNEASPTDMYTHAAIIIEIPDDWKHPKKEAGVSKDLNGDAVVNVAVDTDICSSDIQHVDLPVERVHGLKSSVESLEEEKRQFDIKLKTGKTSRNHGDDGGADYYSMTVPSLKDLCRQHRLKVGGNKLDLIARLESM